MDDVVDGKVNDESPEDNDESPEVNTDTSNYAESNSSTVSITSIFNDVNLLQFLKKMIPTSHEKYNYIYLDSTNCIEISSNRDKFKWLINDKIPVYETGYINLSSILRNIKMMRIGRITYSHFPLSQYAPMKENRIGIGFEEFASQAIVLPNVKIQNIVSKLPDDNQPGNVVSLSGFNNNRGWFRFREKFLTLDHLTMYMWDTILNQRVVIPDAYTTLPALQLFQSVIVDGLSIPNPLQVGNWEMIPVWNIPINNATAGMVRGYTIELINISGFTTSDPVGDAAIIAAYNTPHILQAVKDFLFLPPVNISAATIPPGSKIPVTLTFMYKPRFVGTLELVSEDDAEDDDSDETNTMANSSVL